MKPYFYITMLPRSLNSSINDDLNNKNPTIYIVNNNPSFRTHIPE